MRPHIFSLSVSQTASWFAIVSLVSDPLRFTLLRPGRLQNRREVLEDALCLSYDAPLDHLASGRVLGDLSAEDEETIDLVAWKMGRPAARVQAR